MSQLALSADLGGTNLRMGVIDSEGTVHFVAKRPTPEEAVPGELKSLISEMGDECKQELSFGRSISCVAFTAPAPVSKEFDGVLTKLPNLPGLVGWDLRAALREIFELPVTIENDATAAGIGEHWVGASAGVNNFVCVTLGTGIGGGIFVYGEPVRGLDGTGGEIGHICVEPAGHKCGCGSHGCIEQYASATAIVRMAEEAGLDIASAGDVFDLYAEGDQTAAGVFRSMGNYLGITLAGLANALNPEMFVLCGGVTAGWDAFAPHVESEIKRRAYAAAADRAPIVRGKLGDNAGMIGAARSAFLAGSAQK